VIQGLARRTGEIRRHIITSTIEHKSVIEPCRYLINQGFEVTWLRPDRTGRIAPEQVEDAIRDDTVLVSLMLGHNELGTINPIAEIGSICRAWGVAMHSDAAQAYGKIPIDVERLGVDFLTFSGHKIYGPKGVGALYIRRSSPRAELQPLLMGGDQERGIRCGTLNVAGIVGCGAAAELAGIEMVAEAERLAGLRDRLWCGLTEKLDGVLLNGDNDHRLPHTLNVAFLYVEGESLMVNLGDIAVSSGSACTSASIEPSYVLRGIGLDDEMARGSIRFSLGRFNTKEEIDRTIDRVVDTVTQLRRANPRFELAGRRRSAL
jgi:cysteine desulfurase